MLGSVHRACRVLSLFSPERPGWGVSELALELDVAKSSAHALLVTLGDAGLVRRCPDGRYQLGWRVLELSRSLVQTTAFLGHSHSILQQCATRFDAVVHIAALQDDELVVLDGAVGPTRQHAAVMDGIGTTMLANGTALGAVLRAFDARRRFGMDVTPLGVATGRPPGFRPRYLHTEHRVRVRGYAYDVRGVDGLFCVAAPIRDDVGAVVAAVSVAATAERFRRDAEQFRDAARAVAARLSWGLHSSTARLAGAV